MASNFDVDQVVDKIASDVPQIIGDFGAQMLPVPREYQVETSYVISYAAYRLLTDVFEVAAGTGFSFNAMSLTLKQIQKQIEELAKKVDKLLMADMKTAEDRFLHGMNYIKREETFPWAFREFNEVLSLAEKAYPKVEAFEDKVFCKQLAIFTRVMISTYDPETKQFVALFNLSEVKKRVIADSVFHDVESVIQQFEAIEIPWSKKLSGKGKREKEKNQNILDSLLKRCLPAIWNFQDIFMCSNENLINKYIPEGADDAANLTLRSGARVCIWKQMVDRSTYKFQWFPYRLQNDAFESIVSSPFPMLNGESCSSQELPIKYTCRDKSFNNVKDYFKYTKNNIEDDENKNKVDVTFSDLNDIKYLNLFDENTSLKFNGWWYSDFIDKMNSKEDLLKALKAMHQNLRLNGKDKYGRLIIHMLLFRKKEWCEREMLDLVLNEQNSLAKDRDNRTVLHCACYTNKLELVKCILR